MIRLDVYQNQSILTPTSLCSIAQHERIASRWKEELTYDFVQDKMYAMISI